MQCHLQNCVKMPSKRLRPFLLGIISPAQSAFILGMTMIVDNALFFFQVLACPTI